jgi:polyferredoxin
MTGWNCAQNEIAVITDIKGKSVQRTENKCLPWYKNIIRMREHKLSK